MPDEIEGIKQLLLEIENNNDDSTKDPEKIEDIPPELFEHITDGCGGANLRPWMHEFLEPVCRRHDLRYQRGYSWWHRITADILLFIEGVRFCLWMIAICPKLILKSLAALVMIPIYFVLLIFSGWYTFSRFKFNGDKMTGFQTLSVMELRADLRKEEANPKASYNEKKKAKKAQEKMIINAAREFRNK